MPATIVSRCQRFDFMRLSPGDIVARINHIAEHENFTITEDAAFLIARLADGSMRTRLPAGQMHISQREVDADVVAGVAGLVGNDYLFELSKAVREKDSASALSIIGGLHESSHDMERLCSELTEFYRNLMIAKACEIRRA